MIRDLASLLKPVSEESFLSNFLEKKRLHVKSDDPGRAVPLFPWATINQVIESDLLPPDRLRAVRANVNILPSMFRRKDGSQQLRAGALRGLLRQGVSLVINFVDDIVPNIGHLSDAIERRLGHSAWVNAYLSFGRGSAFKAHWDAHDVLVLQVHGSKRWRSFGTPMPFPVEDHGPSEPFAREIIWEGLLGPGDVLYLPRGEVHEATLEEPESAHLTIGIRAPHGIDLLRSMVEKAPTDIVAREDLTRLAGESALRECEKRLKDRLHALIEATSLTDYLASEDEKRKPRPLLNIGLVEDLNPATTITPALRRRVPLFTENEAELDVVIGGEPFRLSVGERRVLDLLLTRNCLAFSELVAAFRGTMHKDALHKAVIDLAKKALVGLRP